MLLDEIFKGTTYTYQEHSFKGKTYYTGIATFNSVVGKRLQENTKINGFHNRKVLTSARKQLIVAMNTSSWKLTGQTIVLDSKGSVIDGGHRISSVVQGGAEAFDSFFTFGGRGSYV